MNLVTDIMDQFSGDLTGRLSSLLNTDEDSVSYAASAAVPALLAGLSSLASSKDGATKVSSALGGMASSSMDQIAGMLRGDADAVALRGTNLLSSLFGDGMVNSVVGMVSRASGLSGDTIRKLLSYLAPMVMGKVASAWKAKGATPQALTNLLSEQRHNIAEAMPAGISLAEIPGWSTVKVATATTAETGRRAAATAGAATSSAASWAIPLLIGALALFMLWSYMRNRPEEAAVVNSPAQTTQEVTAQKPVVPGEAVAIDVDGVNDKLKDIFTKAGDAFREISDATSAEAAKPKLEELSRQLDDAKKMMISLPEAGITSIRQMADSQIASLKEPAEKTLETPGLSAEAKSLINKLLEKLDELFTAPAP
jgi:hypothetical protein